MCMNRTSEEYSILAKIFDNTLGLTSGIYDTSVTNADLTHPSFRCTVCTVIPVHWVRVIVFFCRISSAFWYMTNTRRHVVVPPTGPIQALTILDAYLDPDDKAVYFFDIIVENNEHVHLLCFGRRWLRLRKWLSGTFEGLHLLSDHSTHDTKASTTHSIHLYKTLMHTVENCSASYELCHRHGVCITPTWAGYILPFFSQKHKDLLWTQAKTLFKKPLHFLFMYMLTKHTGYNLIQNPHYRIWSPHQVLDCYARTYRDTDEIDTTIPHGNIVSSFSISRVPNSTVVTLLHPEHKVFAFAIMGSPVSTHQSVHYQYDTSCPVPVRCMVYNNAWYVHAKLPPNHELYMDWWDAQCHLLQHPITYDRLCL